MMASIEETTDYMLEDISDSYYCDEVTKLADRIACDIGVGRQDANGNFVGIDVQVFSQSLSTHAVALSRIVWYINEEISESDNARMCELLSWINRYVPIETMNTWRAYGRIWGVRSGMKESLAEELSVWALDGERPLFSDAIMPDDWNGSVMVEKCGFIARTYDRGNRIRSQVKNGNEPEVIQF